MINIFGFPAVGTVSFELALKLELFSLLLPLFQQETNNNSKKVPHLFIHLMSFF